MPKKEIEVVVTGPDTVFAYPHLFEPYAPVSGGKPKYRACLIVPKSDTQTVQKLREAIRHCYEENAGFLKADFKDVNNPLKDGDTRKDKDPAYKNAYYLDASSIAKPRLIGRDKQEIIDPADFYPGVIGRASVNFYAYNMGVNKGIGCGLRCLKKLRDGTPLGFSASPDVDFAGYDDDEDDFLG
ncbi:MAG: DUF2815 family protein [Oscillospiraceae bacterium]|nr:DUF2815 family protein [Oscillospiraceae bacterium]